MPKSAVCVKILRNWALEAKGEACQPTLSQSCRCRPHFACCVPKLSRCLALADYVSRRKYTELIRGTVSYHCKDPYVNDGFSIQGSIRSPVWTLCLEVFPILLIHLYCRIHPIQIIFINNKSLPQPLFPYSLQTIMEDRNFGRMAK